MTQKTTDSKNESTINKEVPERYKQYRLVAESIPSGYDLLMNEYYEDDDSGFVI